MRASIVILTFNQREVTLRCLDALDEFMRGHSDVEIIVVDNGSADGTGSAIEDRRYAWAPRLTYRRKDSNSGVAAGRNSGIRMAKGDIIVLLDNDTVPTSRVLSELIGHVERNPRCGVAAPGLMSADGAVQNSAKSYPGLLEKMRNVLSSGQPPMPEHPYYVIGACQVFRRSVVDEVGELDENIFYGPEDADFCARIRKAGYSIDYIPSLSMIHDYRRATSRNVLSPLGRRHIKALLYFWWKHRRLF